MPSAKVTRASNSKTVACRFTTTTTTMTMKGVDARTCILFSAEIRKVAIPPWLSPLMRRWPDLTSRDEVKQPQYRSLLSIDRHGLIANSMEALPILTVYREPFLHTIREAKLIIAVSTTSKAPWTQSSSLCSVLRTRKLMASMRLKHSIGTGRTMRSDGQNESQYNFTNI